MAEEQLNIPNSPEKENIRPAKKPLRMTKGLHNILGGDLLSKDSVLSNLPFLVFLAILAMLYIGNTYYAEKTFKAIEKTKNELKELRFQYITVKADLLYYSKQTEIAKRIATTGLKEPVKPPYKIFYSKDNIEKETDMIERSR